MNICAGGRNVKHIFLKSESFDKENSQKAASPMKAERASPRSSKTLIAVGDKERYEVRGHWVLIEIVREEAIGRKVVGGQWSGHSLTLQTLGGSRGRDTWAEETPGNIKSKQHNGSSVEKRCGEKGPNGEETQKGIKTSQPQLHGNTPEHLSLQTKNKGNP